MPFSSRLACSFPISSDENTVCPSVPFVLVVRGMASPDCFVVISSVSSCVAVPAIVRALSSLKRRGRDDGENAPAFGQMSDENELDKPGGSVLFSFLAPFFRHAGRGVVWCHRSGARGLFSFVLAP